jgi:hypothetical protein
MCDLITINEKDYIVKDHLPPGSVFFYKAPGSNGRAYIDTPVYWDGWAREESLDDWIEKGWTKAHVECEKYSVLTPRVRRNYELPTGHSINGVASVIGNKMVLRVVTREAKGKEKEVKLRFASIGRLHD